MHAAARGGPGEQRISKGDFVWARSEMGQLRLIVAHEIDLPAWDVVLHLPRGDLWREALPQHLQQDGGEDEVDVRVRVRVGVRVRMCK